MSHTCTDGIHPSAESNVPTVVFPATLAEQRMLEAMAVDTLARVHLSHHAHASTFHGYTVTAWPDAERLHGVALHWQQRTPVASV